MISLLYKTLLQNTYTLQHLKHRLKILKIYFSQVFFKASQESLNEGDNLWVNSLPKDFIVSFSKDNCLNRLGELENEINQLQTLILYLPFEVTAEALEKIGQKARILFNPSLVLDIKYNPSLLAGCALVWKGIYKDYSLKAMIEARKMEILESFKKFLR